MDNPFLLAMIGLSLATAGGLLGAYLGRRFADRVIEREKTRLAKPKPDPELMSYEERTEYYVDLTNMGREPYEQQILDEFHGKINDPNN